MPGPDSSFEAHSRVSPLITCGLACNVSRDGPPSVARRSRCQDDQDLDRDGMADRMKPGAVYMAPAQSDTQLHKLLTRLASTSEDENALL